MDELYFASGVDCWPGRAAKNHFQSTSGRNVSIIPQEALLTQVVNYLILASEAAAAFVIGSAMVCAIISYVKHLLDPMSRQINHTEQIRLRLGHMLNLGLEFAIGSDILRLATSPTTADVIILFAIVLLRILLNYFLEREIKSSLVSVVQVTTSPPSNNQMEK